jgi:hypothetical protein
MQASCRKYEIRVAPSAALQEEAIRIRSTEKRDGWLFGTRSHRIALCVRELAAKACVQPESDLIASEQLAVDALRVTGSQMRLRVEIWTRKLLAGSPFACR